jgi:hypothetical protein
MEAHGEETPSESESSGDGGEEEGQDREGEIISPPQSPLPESLLSLDDLFGWQMGIPAKYARRNTPGRMPMGCPACHRSLTLHWYVFLVGSVRLRRWCMGGSFTRCPIGSPASTGRWCCCIGDYRVVLIGRWRCGAPVQEGPSMLLPAIVFLVRAWCRSRFSVFSVPEF